MDKVLAVVKETRLFLTFRAQRDILLKDTDIYMLTDNYSKLTEAQKEELTQYRQALRDSPYSWILPTKPDWIK